MTDIQLIGLVTSSTQTGAGTSPDRVPALPYDLLKAASKRLEIMSVLAAALWVLGTVGDRIALWQWATQWGDSGSRRT